MAGVASEARGFDRGVARVFAAVCGAGVGNDHADFFFRQMEMRRESSSRTPKGRCVPVQTLMPPSFHSATAARGSSGAWAMYSTV